MDKMQDQLDCLKELRLMGYGGASVLEGITKHISSNLLVPKLRDNAKTVKMQIANEFKSQMVGIPTSRDLDKLKND